MGSLQLRRCKCGYEETFMIGGGMANFTTFCAFPSLCKMCKNVVGINLLEEDQKCPSCGGDDLVPYGRRPVARDAGKSNHCPMGPNGRTRKETNTDERMLLLPVVQGIRFEV